MAKSKRRKSFYLGELDLIESKERFDKYAQKVAMTPIEIVEDETGLTQREIRERYNCMTIDGQLYVNF